MPDLLITKKEDAKPSHPVGLFHSFCEYPTGVRFKNQQDDEEINLFLRRHFITNVPWIVIALLLLIAPPIVIPFIVLVTPIALPLTTQAQTTLLVFYYIIIFGYILVNFLHWFYNIGIVTDRTVVDLDYSEIVNVNVATTKVSQIEDVVYQQNGFLQPLFNYGDVFVQTAGEKKEFEFLRIPNPERAVTIIRNLIGRRT